MRLLEGGKGCLGLRTEVVGLMARGAGIAGSGVHKEAVLVEVFLQCFHIGTDIADREIARERIRRAGGVRKGNTFRGSLLEEGLQFRFEGGEKGLKACGRCGKRRKRRKRG